MDAFVIAMEGFFCSVKACLCNGVFTSIGEGWTHVFTLKLKIFLKFKNFYKACDFLSILFGSGN